MKKLLPLLLVILLPLNIQAGLYKGLDEDGSVVYSDKPFAGSQKHKLAPISVVDAPKVIEKTVADDESEEDEGEEKPQVNYTRFRIVAPSHQQVIWNNDSLSVALVLEPSLNTAGGDYLSLLMDGKTVVKKTLSQLIQLPRAERGEHRLQALLRNRKGKVVKRSQTVTVHIKQTVVPAKSPR